MDMSASESRIGIGHTRRWRVIDSRVRSRREDVKGSLSLAIAAAATAFFYLLYLA
jgi:hypothetical protein